MVAKSAPLSSDGIVGLSATRSVFDDSALDVHHEPVAAAGAGEGTVETIPADAVTAQTTSAGRKRTH